MRPVDGDGCRLEPQGARHADALFAVLSDPAIYRYENAPPASVQALRERLARLESRQSPDGGEQWLNWVVWAPGDPAPQDGDPAARPSMDHLAGFVQATVMPDGRAFIAYVFGSRSWGRGLATRAVSAMLVELAAHHGVRRFVADVKVDNAPSLRLLARLGFSAGRQGDATGRDGAGDDAVYDGQPDDGEARLGRDAAPAVRKFTDARG